MGRFQRVLDHPLIMYLVIGTFSVTAAYLFWMIGGNLATIISEKAILGVAFEFGGAIAGFGAVFWLSLLVLERLNRLQFTRNVKVFLVPRSLFRIKETYSCKVSVFDREIGKYRILDLTPHGEAGHLTIEILDLGRAETFQIELRDSNNKIWRSEYYHVAAPRAEMKPL